MAEKTRILSFFGPPGTGKGTIAVQCARDFGYKMLSTGALLRKHIQEQTDLGNSLAEHVNKGQLIPDDLMAQMVFEWLKQEIAPGITIILDGFPRTKGQADIFLQGFQQDPDFSEAIFKIINFELSEDEIVKRISSRLVCSNKECQESYSTTAKMPKQMGVCDLCNSPLARRPDDEASVVRERMNIFASFKDDLMTFYSQSGQEVVNFLIPPGGPDVVFEAFAKII